jgi:hypothetical protein
MMCVFFWCKYIVGLLFEFSFSFFKIIVILYFKALKIIYRYLVTPYLNRTYDVTCPIVFFASGCIGELVFGTFLTVWNKVSFIVYAVVMCVVCSEFLHTIPLCNSSFIWCYGVSDMFCPVLSWYFEMQLYVMHFACFYMVQNSTHT